MGMDRTWLLAVVALAALPATAQDVGGGPTELGEIRVQGAAPAPESRRSDLAFPTTGFGREVIEQVPDRRLGGALQRLPGVTMGGAPGERKDVRLRAIDKKFTRTEFGGVQLSDGGEKREFQVWRFPSFLAGEVEVIRNPTAEFEADGLAGRIRVDFREIPEERTIEASAAVGTGTDLDFGDQRSFQAAYGERFGDFGVQLAFSRVADPLVKVKEKLKGGSLAETEDELKDLTFTDGFADFAWYGDNQTLHVRPLVLNLEEDKDKEKRKFKDGALDKLELETEDELKRTKAVIVDHKWRLGGGVKLDSTFAWSDTDEDKDKLKEIFKADGALDKIETETEEKEDETFELKTAATVPFTLGVAHELKFGGAIRQRDRFKDKTKLEIKGDEVKGQGRGQGQVRPRRALRGAVRAGHRGDHGPAERDARPALRDGAARDRLGRRDARRHDDPGSAAQHPRAVSCLAGDHAARLGLAGGQPPEIRPACAVHGGEGRRSDPGQPGS